MAYKVERGVSIPEPKHDRRSYPFGEMEIGDSFVFEGDRNRIGSAVSYAASRSKDGRKYTVRKESETTFRVWRTA